MSAAESHSLSAAMYSKEPMLKVNKNDFTGPMPNPNHFILEKWDLRSVLKNLKMLNPAKTIAHFHYPPPINITIFPYLIYLFAPLIFRLKGFRVYQTWHEELSSRAWIKALLWRIATAKIFVVKQDFKDRTSRFSRWILELFDIKYVGSGPLQVLEPKTCDYKYEILKSIKLKDFTKIFLVFGFIFAKRNIELIIKNIDSNSELLIIAGDHSRDPEYHKYLQQLVRLRNYEHCVKFFGFVDNKALTSLIHASTGIIFTNHGGVFNWNTSFLLSCFSSRPVIYLYDSNKGKPKLLGFTETKLDFGIPENRSYMLRNAMDEVKEISTNSSINFDIEDIWRRIFRKHNFQLDELPQ